MLRKKYMLGNLFHRKFKFVVLLDKTRRKRGQENSENPYMCCRQSKGMEESIRKQEKNGRNKEVHIWAEQNQSSTYLEHTT